MGNEKRKTKNESPSPPHAPLRLPFPMTQPRRPAIALALCLSATVAHSQDLPVDKLSLKEVIARTLANNSDIQVQNLGKLIEQERLKVAKQPFDPKLEGSYVYQWINTPQNTQDFVSTGGGIGTPNNPSGSNTTDIGGGNGTPADPILTNPRIFEQRNHVGKLALSSRLPTGTNVELGSTLRVLDNTLNRQLPPSLFNPEWETFTGLTLTQPLLRDWGLRANSAEIRIAKGNVKIADLEWQAKTAENVSEVIKRYYEVIFTRENVAVQAEAVALAQKLLDDTTARSKEGVAAGNDVAVAQAGVSQRQEELLAAQVQYIERQNALQLLFRTSEEIINNGHRLEPTDSLTSSVPPTDRATLMQVATTQRYEVRQADEAVSVRSAQSQLASNQARPRLDLVTSGGYHGLANNFNSTYSEAFSQQGPEWTAGIQFSLPLNLDHMRAGKRAAEHQQSQAEVTREKMRLQVALEVDTVLARMRADEQRLAAAHTSEAAAKQSVEGEMKRLKEGVSTSYQVLQLQREYAQTRSRALAALTDLNKDITDLYYATGTLLEKQGIICEAAQPAPVISIQPTPAAIAAKQKQQQAQRPGLLARLFGKDAKDDASDASDDKAEAAAKAQAKAKAEAPPAPSAATPAKPQAAAKESGKAQAQAPDQSAKKASFFKRLFQ